MLKTTLKLFYSPKIFNLVLFVEIAIFRTLPDNIFLAIVLFAALSITGEQKLRYRRGQKLVVQ